MGKPETKAQGGLENFAAAETTTMTPPPTPEKTKNSTKEKTAAAEENCACFPLSRKSIRRFIGLLTACLCFAVAGSMSAFTEYVPALKAKYMLNQKQVEFVLSSWSLTVNLGYPAGVMEEKLGPRRVLAIAMVIVVALNLVLFSTQYSTQVYIDNPWLFDIYYVLVGFGVCCGFVAVMPLMARNFSAQQQGCITGLLFSFLFIGPASYAAIYGACFINGHNTDPQNQDLAGYFLFSACMAFVVYIFAIIFAEEIPYESEEKSEKADEKSEALSPEEDTQLITMEIGEMPQPPELTGLALLKTLNCHLVLWPYILSPSVQLAFMNNISSYLHSFGLEEYTTAAAVLSPAIGSVANLAIGTLSDKTLHRVPRVFYQLVFNILQTLFLLLCIFWMENITLFIFTTIMLSISYSAMMSISPSILMEVSGMQHYGRNVGGMFFGMGIGVFVLQIVVGLMYDRELHATRGPDHINCYGRGCFVWSFVLMAVMSGIAAGLQAVLLYKRIMLRRRWRF